MSLKRLLIAGAVLAIATLPGSMRATPAGETPAVTFNKDVLPVLQKNCQTCHRPGEIAPMSFLTYADSRPYARAMKTAVVARQMPPWFADPAYGHFANDKRLSDGDRGPNTGGMGAYSPLPDLDDARLGGTPKPSSVHQRSAGYGTAGRTRVAWHENRVRRRA